MIPVSYEGRPAYKIHIKDSFKDLSSYMAEIWPSETIKICIVSDSIVGHIYAKNVQNELNKAYSEVKTYFFAQGEQHKTLTSVEGLYEFLIKNRFTRKDVLVALGGGVVGDMTGFAAATYLRGISFVQVPTTLLSQVDSSVGGKTGVDFLSYKNMVGAFHMPKLVYINTKTLKTLPPEQFSSGMGEVIKYGLIMNQPFFEWVNMNQLKIANQDPDILSEMIAACCEYKRQIVEKDPNEQGIRAILNFGHTIGHAIEKCSDFRLFHGWCVGLGMIAAIRISEYLGIMDENIYKKSSGGRTLTDDLKNLLKSFDMPLKAESISKDDVLLAARYDKKNEGDGMRLILLSEAGKAVIESGVSDDAVLLGIREVLAS